VLAQHWRREAAQKGGGLMGFTGLGRVFTRKAAEAHSKARSHDGFAKAVDLELPLLRPWQHEICDP
jgi:hypothetical protein